MNFQLLIDPASAGFVLAGTLVATLARSGWKDSFETLRQARALLRKPFNLAQSRSELASQVARMRQDGVIRVEPSPVSDAEFSDATAALTRHRSVAALVEEHERHVEARTERRQQAIETLSEAGDLAPVLGLAGTFLALSLLPARDLSSEGAVMGAVATAVVSTFYGLLFGHLIFFPLAGAIARRGRREEADRQQLVDWLVGQLEPACPRHPLERDEAA